MQQKYVMTKTSGVFSTGATGALVPIILGQYYCHFPLTLSILGQSITVSTRNSKVLNTPLIRLKCHPLPKKYQQKTNHHQVL